MSLEALAHSVMRDLGLDFPLKGAQMEILDVIFQGQHCFSVLPTGYGKSMTFVLPPLMKDRVSMDNFFLIFSLIYVNIYSIIYYLCIYVLFFIN